MVNSNSCKVLWEDTRKRKGPKHGKKKPAEVIAVSFGADFCTEHEMGIQPLRQLLGMDNNAVGLERIQARLAPEPFFFEGTIDGNYVVAFAVSCTGGKLNGFKDKKQVLRLLDLYPYLSNTHLYTAWDDRGFGMLGNDEASISVVREMYEAYLNCNIAIYMNRPQCFGNAGFVVAKASMLPQSLLEKFKKEDLEKKAL